MFHEILSNQLKYPLEKRQQFYHILLYQYLRLIDLDKSNIIHVLTKIINVYDTDIDEDDVDHIVRNGRIDGKALQILIDDNSSDKLSNAFQKLSIMRNHWKKIHEFIRNWEHNKFTFKSKENEEEEIKENIKDSRHKPLVNTLNEKSLALQRQISYALSSDILNSRDTDEESVESDDDDRNQYELRQSVEEINMIYKYKNHIPRSVESETDHSKDPYPSYIYKSVCIHIVIF